MLVDSAELSKRTDFTVVLIHGWGMNQGVWSEFQEALAKDISQDVVCIDLPGFGGSINDNVAPYNIETISIKVAAELPERSVVIGWSLGGLVAQHIAVSGNPNIIAHIQMCSTPKFEQSENWPGIKPNVLEMFHAQLVKDHRATIKRFLAIQFMGINDAKVAIKETLAMITAFPLSEPATLLESLQILSDADLRLKLSEQEPMPCLRIFGRLDSLVPLSVVEHITALAPNDHVHVIEKASHAPFISHLVETKACICDFLATLK
ncbi:MAG: pimeloyl-ACP methyl ester esterase BioH [Glaciecola sp.]